MTTGVAIRTTEPLSMTGRAAAFLRTVLRVDAAGCLLMGVVYLSQMSAMAELMGISRGVVAAAGTVLTTYAAVALIVSLMRSVRVGWIFAVIAVNVIWAVDTAVLMLSGWFPLTEIGIVWHLAQIVIVGVFGVLQYVGMRKAQA